MSMEHITPLADQRVQDVQTIPWFGSSGFHYAKRRLSNTIFIATGDAIGLGIGLLAAGLFRYLLKGEPMMPGWFWATILIWTAGGLSMNLIPGWGIGAVEELRRTVYLVIALFSLIAIGLFLVKSGAEISRLTLTAAICVSGPAILIIRRLTRSILIRKNLWGLPTVIYGSQKAALKMEQALSEHPENGFIPVGILTDGDEAAKEQGSLPGFDHMPQHTSKNIRGRLENAPAAILTSSDIPRSTLIRMLEGPLSRYRRVVIIPDLLDAPSLWVSPRDLGGILGLEVSHNLLDPFSRLMKRTFDLAVVILMLPVWLPLMSLVALLIWLNDRAAPIFSHQRIGKNNKPFGTLKFRTMVPNAEQALEEALQKDESLRQEWETAFKLKNDPRLTQIGHLLRKTSLDEIPQFLNVLSGSMSLVGPRPLPQYHQHQLPAQIQRLRERVSPGITGLWQVSGRSEAGNEGMIRHDAYYVRNWSIWLDIVILVRTFRAVVKSRGAY